MLSTTHSERMGYPTQKPLALLDRIIKASSNKGDILWLWNDRRGGPAARTALDRGDICVNACKVIERCIRAHFDSLWDSVEFIGMPKTVDDTKMLASLDKCSQSGQVQVRVLGRVTGGWNESEHLTARE